RFMWRPLGRRRVPGVRRGGIPAEGPLDELPRPRRIHVVRALTRRRVGQDAVGILPQAILLVAILELDPEPAREDAEVVLDRDRPLRLEPTDEPLAAVIDRREDLGAALDRPIDLGAEQPVPDLLAQLGRHGGGAEPAEPRLRLDLDDPEPGDRLQEAPGGGALAPA